GKSFANGVVALERLSLKVSPGEFVSLLGPSGCGKSTALRIIAGLSEPSSGRVEWPGVEAAARRNGFVVQEAALMPTATVAGNGAPAVKTSGSRAERTSTRRCGARARRPFRLCGELSARALRRHEDARLDRSRTRHRAEPSFDGRAVCCARRDHALSSQ